MLVRAVINGSLRKLGRLGGGREPRLADQQDTLAALQGMYRAWIASGAMGRLADVVPTSDYVARPNERVFRQSDDVSLITLPELIRRERWVWDCCDCTLQYRPYDDTILDLTYNPDLSEATTPRDASVVVVADQCTGETYDFLYDGSIKQWQGIHSLTLDSEAPRSFADPQGLQACLAIEASDIFGADVSPATVRQAARFQTALTSRWSMPPEAIAGVYC